MKRLLLYLGVILCAVMNLEAQEEVSFGEESTEEESKHQIGFLLGHAHIPSLYADGKKEWKALPSFTLYYNYWLNETWAVGLHTDMIIESYEVEKNLASKSEEDLILERERPLAPALMAVYMPGEHFNYSFGFGGEFAKGEDLFLFRAEIAYAIEMPKSWEFEVALGTDVRWDAYNTINMAIGISKRL
ncbi:hypothetical protein [Aestuariibaculum sediminum]|uniref:Outer membrane protein beta-barrel domain-containing protein n=1 Tax=Aestuariibaculum sediminum TaxID=2770637 RepID=A0A8J6Q7J1_9FLAO|nr:hypothetical protein [Aestuariibaculum sediminum]MBD0830637.1 hypothetical protein [Aestuariibaculum sediminum]